MPYVRHIFYIIFSSYNFLLNTILRKLLKVCWISCLRRVGRMPFFLLCCGSFITISMALPSIFEPPTSLNPAFTFRPKKTGRRNNLFHCSLPNLFLCPQMNPSQNSLLVSDSGIQRKEAWWYFCKRWEEEMKMCWMQTGGGASGDGSFHPENWWKLPRNAKRSFSARPKIS